MPDPLSVSADGLRLASAALAEDASQLTVDSASAPAGTKPSSVGAASFSASIAAFSRAYAALLADHGQSTALAAGSYTTVDDDGAADIGTVSV